MNDLQCKPVTTRKKHCCEWCGQAIEKGEKAQYRAYVFDGDFNSAWQHPDCFEAMCESDTFYLAEGFELGSNERGVPML